MATATDHRVKLKAGIRVMNNVSVGWDLVEVECTVPCGQIHLVVPSIKDGIVIELNRNDLVDFIRRTGLLVDSRFVVPELDLPTTCTPESSKNP